jgi:hypothetical protein
MISQRKNIIRSAAEAEGGGGEREGTSGLV